MPDRSDGVDVDRYESSTARLESADSYNRIRELRDPSRVLDRESCCHVEGLLNWSQSTSWRRYDLKAVDEGCLQIRGSGDFGMDSRESIHVLITEHIL